MTERETPITQACKSWRGVLPVHPACEIIPAYDDSKLIKLGRDLKASGGMKIPIIVLVQPGGTHALVDGRSRLDALCHVGIKFEIKVIDGHVVVDAPGYDIPAPMEIVPDENFNVYAFVLSTNLHRRHLKNKDKRTITIKVITIQPTLSDRAIARMAGVDGKTVKLLRQEINANAEFRISDRVEATGRRARGRKPSQIKESSVADQKARADDSSSNVPVVKPVDVTPTTHPDDKLPVATIEVCETSTKAKPAVAPNTFNAAEILAAARRALEVLGRPVSGPNNETARREIKRVIDLLLNHKSLKSTATERARAA
jgi:hypothetical protein